MRCECTIWQIQGKFFCLAVPTQSINVIYHVITWELCVMVSLTVYLTPSRVRWLINVSYCSQSGKKFLLLNWLFSVILISLINMGPDVHLLCLKINITNVIYQMMYSLMINNMKRAEQKWKDEFNSSSQIHVTSIQNLSEVLLHFLWLILLYSRQWRNSLQKNLIFFTFLQQEILLNDYKLIRKSEYFDAEHPAEL